MIDAPVLVAEYGRAEILTCAWRDPLNGAQMNVRFRLVGATMTPLSEEGAVRSGQWQVTINKKDFLSATTQRDGALAEAMSLDRTTGRMALTVAVSGPGGSRSMKSAWGACRTTTPGTGSQGR
jgi:hypothetical protein